MTMPGFAVGSWNVPGDMFTKVHAGETILNAGDASNFRGAIDNVGGGGGGETHLHVHAVDAKSVQRLFMDNGHHIAQALKRQVRNFSPTNA